MVVDVYKHVELCFACAENRLSERRQKSTIKLFPALELFSGLAVDLLGPLTSYRGGHKHVMVICDRFIKLTRAIPLRDATALTVSSAFMILGSLPMASPTLSLRTTDLSLPRYITRASSGCWIEPLIIPLPTTSRMMGRWNDTTAPWCGSSDALLQSIRQSGTVICPS